MATIWASFSPNRPRALVRPCPPQPMIAMYTFSLGATNFAPPSTCRGTMLNAAAAPAAPINRLRVNLERSVLMSVLSPNNQDPSDDDSRCRHTSRPLPTLTNRPTSYHTPHPSTNTNAIPPLLCATTSFVGPSLFVMLSEAKHPARRSEERRVGKEGRS